MVSEENKKEQPTEDKADKEQENSPTPQLSADFYRRLLKLPPCKTTGVCNNCGRCEH